jgi:hypothetical protein
LSWSVSDAVTCEASGDWSGSKSLIDEQSTGALSAGSKTFVLSCVDLANENSVANVDVVVANPPTLDFSAVNEIIEYNTSTNLAWLSTNANSCEKYGDWSGITTVSGLEPTENLISEKTFGIRCSGDGGMTEEEILISISNPNLQVQLDFTAESLFIDYAEKTTLNWNVSNADFCTASGAWSGAQDKDSGSYLTPVLISNKTYTLYCANNEGSNVTKNITIIVAPQEPVLVSVNATADDQDLEYNTSTIISWTSQNANYCRVYYGSWTGNLLANGSYNTGNLINNKTYTVRCYNNFDTDDDTVLINVAPNLVPPPSLNFYSDAGTVDYNTTTELNWDVTDADSLEASGDWSGSKTIPSGSESTGNLIDDKNYILDAYGYGGHSGINFNVIVGDPISPPTVTITSDLETVLYNEGTVIRWTSEHADWCKLSYGGSTESIGDEGNRFTGNLTAETNYEVECGNEAGAKSVSVLVKVLMTGPPPSITLTADLNPVPYGTGTKINWLTLNATNCMLSGVGEVEINASFNTGNLYLPKTYTLTCVGNGGTNSKNITIGISGTPANLPSISLWADDYSFYGNGATTLHWTTVDADKCWATAGPWSGDKSIPSGDEVTNNLTVSTLFEISCENINGTVSDSVTIVIDPASDVELSFYADNTEIELNSYVTLTWNGKNANWCESYSFDNFSDWGQYQSQIAGTESNVTVGPITNYNTQLLLRCWNYTSNTNWRIINIKAGDHPPSITMSAPSMVAYNSPATISWFADYADSCLAWASPAEPTWTGSRAITGLQLTSNLKTETFFYLKCINSEGTETTVNKRVKVGPSTGIAPQINFTADKYIANEGESYTLNWNVTNASWCSANSNPIDNLWFGNKNSVAGSQIMTFSGDQKELVLTCGNSNGSMSAIVRINKGGTEIGIPSISFWADQMSLPVNGKTMLRWYVENAESCQAFNAWSGIKASGSGQEQTIALNATSRFELHCSNVAGTRIAVVDIVVGGPPPDVIIDFNASRYDVSAGNSTTLSWTASNASYCYAIDPNGVFVGGKTTMGSDTLIPPASTTYKIVCGNSGGERTSIVSIVVAKVIVCPNPGRIVNVGGTLQLIALFKPDADIGFSCSNPSGSQDVTTGWNGFTIEWTSANDAVITVSSGGLATGLRLTELSGGPVLISAEYKETKGSSNLIVSPPPVTCWKCSEDKTCFSDITFPISGSCPNDTYDSMYECAKSCRKPVDWQEIGS